MHRFGKAFAAAIVLSVTGCGAGASSQVGTPGNQGSTAAPSRAANAATAPATQAASWGPFTSCPDLSRIGYPDGEVAEQTGTVLKCSYSGTPAVIVEYHPEGYAQFRSQLLSSDYSQGGGAQEWPALSPRAVRSFSGDETMGTCSFLLPSSSDPAYVVVSTALEPGDQSYCDVAEKAAQTLSSGSSTGPSPEESTQAGVRALGPATSKNFGLTFEIAEHPYADPLPVTTSSFTLSSLTLKAEAVRTGDRVTVTVTPSARGRYTLVRGPRGFTYFSGVLTASPLWKQDSLFCREAIPKHSSRPLADVISRQAVAPIGIMTARDYSELQRYPYAPYCGLNWQGYAIQGANDEVRDGGSLELRGEDASFDVVTSPAVAEEVLRQALTPAGWAFVYGEQPVNAPDSCPQIATGPVGYSTVDLC